MSALLEAPDILTVEDLREQLGGIPVRRILVRPSPGTATVDDVSRLLDHHDRRCELVDGTLVEKAKMGWEEANIGGEIYYFIRDFLRTHDLGILTGDQGTIQLWLGRVRIPDVAYYSWDRFPGMKKPKGAVPLLTPDIAIEVLSESNTRREMDLKRQDYFQSGTILVWEIDPVARTVEVFTAVDESTTLEADGTLDGGAVLPGFQLPLRDLFAKLDRLG
jgi:Uma2 family endonuclease